MCRLHRILSSRQFMWWNKINISHLDRSTDVCTDCKSIYFNDLSQGNSANYYLILGLQDKAAPPKNQQINKFPPKPVKNPATRSSIFIFVFSSSTGELCSQPIRGNDRPNGQMFPEHVERSFLDPNIASTNISNSVCEEKLAQLRSK